MLKSLKELQVLRRLSEFLSTYTELIVYSVFTFPFTRREANPLGLSL